MLMMTVTCSVSSVIGNLKAYCHQAPFRSTLKKGERQQAHPLVLNPSKRKNAPADIGGGVRVEHSGVEPLTSTMPL